MDILIQIIGYSFIPLMAILVFSGAQDIFSGLKDFYATKPIKLNIPSGRTAINSMLAKAHFDDRDYCQSA